jgi:hypothetical protein
MILIPVWAFLVVMRIKALASAEYRPAKYFSLG